MSLRHIRYYPSALLGSLVILGLIGVALHTLMTMPYATAVAAWRVGDPMLPINARPVWWGWLSGQDLPATIRVSGATNPTEALREGIRRASVELPFAYASSTQPSEIKLFIEETAGKREILFTLTGKRPDGREVDLGQRRIRGQAIVRLDPEALMLASGNGEELKALSGQYALTLDALCFDAAELSANLVVYGQVHGWAGTDHRRRDLGLALRWGTVVALGFGLIAALVSSIGTLTIAATGVWLGGVVDAAIQRLTEVAMIMPVIPVLMLIGTLYTSSLWGLLPIVILFGWFSSELKSHRAMLLPMRDAPYIQSAVCYGASHARIVLRYLVPRTLPILIPSLITSIPAFVFLEASLSYLGLGDPSMPTWGKVLADAQSQSALFNDQAYWVIEPVALLMLSGIGFALIGHSLDRVLNPRLRSY